MAPKRNAALEAMIEEATVNAYNDDEQLTGLFTMIEEHLAVPFTTTVLGVEVTVKKVDLTADNFVAMCVRGREPGAPVRQVEVRVDFQSAVLI